MENLMSHVESNTEMIRGLSFQIEELKAIIEKLIEAIQEPPKDQD